MKRSCGRGPIGVVLLAVLVGVLGADGASPAAERMVVEGRVVDPTGKPVAGATVHVRARDLDREQVLLLEMGAFSIEEARTDASGRFQVEGPRTSTWRGHADLFAIAGAPGFGIGWAELNADADRPSAEITLRPEQVIRGRLVDVSGKPVAGVSVRVQSIDRVRDDLPPNRLTGRKPGEGVSYWDRRSADRPPWPRPSTTDAEGRFTVLGVGKGLRVILNADDPRFAHHRIELMTDDASGTKSIAETMPAAQVITGRLTYADNGQGVPHAAIRVMSSHGNMARISVFETDAEGRFRLNPWPADQGHRLTAFPPEGEPYLFAEKRVAWPAGTVEKAVDLALPRGALVRGSVVEEGSGRPVSGLTVQYIDPRPKQMLARLVARTSADGTFRIGVAPGPVVLLAVQPGGDLILGEFPSGPVVGGKRGATRYRAYAHFAIDPKPGDEVEGIRLVVRRGVTVFGRIVGPDGRPVEEAAILGRTILNPRHVQWSSRDHLRVRGGRFELHGIDPDAETPFHFLDAARGLGATVVLSGKSIAMMTLAARKGGAAPGASIAFGDRTHPRGPLVVRLESCGSAVARLVDSNGQPIAGPLPGRVTMVVTPGAPFVVNDASGALLADEAALTTVDPVHYPKEPAPDADGTLRLPILIPGATYRIIERDRRNAKILREFRAEAGRELDLGELAVGKPGG